MSSQVPQFADRMPWYEAQPSNLGPDAPVVENAKGGKQSDSGRALHLLPGRAMLHVGVVLQAGANRYEEREIPNSMQCNWRKLPQHDHINHALAHIFAFLDGDKQDDHLGHAACRMLFALEEEIAKCIT